MSLRPFAYPRLWRGLFVALIVLVLVLSLLPGRTFEAAHIRYNDKLGHFLAYFCLMGFAVQLREHGREWARSAFLLLLMGILVEGLQQLSGWRRADIRDVFANTAGLLCGLAIAVTPAREWLLRLERRFGRSAV